MKYVVSVCRFIVGALFIFSGFVKAVDPLGFSYKLEEYFEVFAADLASVQFLSNLFLWMKEIALPLTMFFVVLEMVLGVMLLFGIRMQLTAWLLLLLILFFTWLTGYTAITNKVAECGCFGDFIHLTPWQSFSKDVVLLVLILVIFIYRKRIFPILKPVTSNIVLVLSIGLGTFLTIYCYRHLPIIDFRAYKAGNNIREQMSLPPGEKADQYISTLRYKDKSSGEIGSYVMLSNNEDQQPWFQQRGLKALPWQDSVWMANHEFVDSKSELVVAGAKPKITDFHVWDNDNADMTAAVLDELTGYHFWVVAYDMDDANKKSFTRLNELAKEADKNKIQFVGLTSTPYEQLDPIRHELNAAFPFYYADGTVLKTIIRSNPGLVLLKGPVVVAMWHYNDLPTWKEVESKYFR